MYSVKREWYQGSEPTSPGNAKITPHLKLVARRRSCSKTLPKKNLEPPSGKVNISSPMIAEKIEANTKYSKGLK
jgi:hypothetical protein